MLSQTGEHGIMSSTNTTAAANKRITPLQLYKSIIQNEGILGLWAGNGANLLRVFPAKSIVFSSNDFYRGVSSRLYFGTTATDDDVAHNDNNNKQRQLPWALSFLSGGLAGMTASAATYPLDLARGRITGKLAGPGGKKHYKGIVNTVVITAKEEGVRALYKGITPTLLGAMPYEGIKFGTVGLLEWAFPKKTTSNDNVEGEEEGGLLSNNITRKIVFGGAGGVSAGLLTYPNDTIRRLLQLQGSKGTTERFEGYFDCLRKTYAKYGIERFYRGAFINIVRMAPNTAIQFGSYELLKQMSEGYF
jgi:hypothetical protein